MIKFGQRRPAPSSAVDSFNDIQTSVRGSFVPANLRLNEKVARASFSITTTPSIELTAPPGSAQSATTSRTSPGWRRTRSLSSASSARVAAPAWMAGGSTAAFRSAQVALMTLSPRKCGAKNLIGPGYFERRQMLVDGHDPPQKAVPTEIGDFGWYSFEIDSPPPSRLCNESASWNCLRCRLDTSLSSYF